MSLPKPVYKIYPHEGSWLEAVGSLQVNEAGALLFFVGERVVAAYAPGTWKSAILLEG